MIGSVSCSLPRAPGASSRRRSSRRCPRAILLAAAFAAMAPLHGAVAAQADRAAADRTIPDQAALYGMTIEEIRIIGARNTKEYVISRELASRVGEAYRAETAKMDVERLDRLGIFSRVNVYGLSEKGGVALVVDVEETFRYLPVVSLSISDENGATLGGGLKSVNLSGKARYLSAVVRFGPATTVECVLRDPWVAGNRVSFDARYFHWDRPNKLFDFNEVADEAFLEIEGRARESWRVGGRVRLENMTSDVAGTTLSTDGRDVVATLEAFVGFDTRDHWNNPRRGWWNEAALARSGAFGSDSDFWRAFADIRHFTPIGDRQSLAFFSLTTLTTGSVGERVAVWQQYGLGGTTTIRGWELGSRIGKNQFINSLEYRYTLMESRPIRIFSLSLPIGLQGVVFGDLGSAWSDRADFEDAFIGGYGAGLRVLLPYVGVVRVEFGLGQPGNGVMVHLGSREKAERQRERVR